MEEAFSHPLERLTNGPVDLCSEKLAAAGLGGGAHEVGGGLRNIQTSAIDSYNLYHYNNLQHSS